MNVEEDIIRIKHTTDYYEILKIARDSPDEIIKKSYRKLALQLHPDKCAVEGCEEGETYNNVSNLKLILI